MSKLLVVDDEIDICEILQFNLEVEDFIVDTANSAEEVLKMDITSYDLLILDVMMEGMSGFKLANQLKKNDTTKTVPIIFLTAKDTENDKLTGFNLGADDYISKPFSIREAIARIKAVLRRTQKEQEEHAGFLNYKTMKVDLDMKKVYINNAPISLTKKEFEILRLFLQQKGNVFTREEILSRVWQDNVYVLDRTIDVNINRLRNKIAPYGKNIVTRMGYGYCFEDD